MSGFPAQILEWDELVDRREVGQAIVGEGFTVPASEPYESWMREVPLPGAELAVRCLEPAGIRTFTPGPPGAGQYSVNRWGRMVFHDSDAGRAMERDYIGIGSPVRVGPINRLASEISAVQQFVTSRRVILPFSGHFFGVAEDTEEGDELEYVVPGPSEGEWILRSVQVVHSQGWASTGASRVRVSKGGVGDDAPFLEALVGAGSNVGSETTGSIGCVGGETLKVFVASAGGHQNVQVVFTLQNA